VPESILPRGDMRLDVQRATPAWRPMRAFARQATPEAAGAWLSTRGGDPHQSADSLDGRSMRPPPDRVRICAATLSRVFRLLALRLCMRFVNDAAEAARPVVHRSLRVVELREVDAQVPAGL